MLETLIVTADMCMARYNASGDELFAHVACSLVILGNIGYHQLDPTAWSRDVYDAMILGSRKDASDLAYEMSE